MPKYRRKTHPINAIKLERLGHNTLTESWFWEAVSKGIIIPSNLSKPDKETRCYVQTLHEVVIAEEGDYILEDERGNMHVCKAKIFEERYELVKK